MYFSMRIWASGNCPLLIAKKRCAIYSLKHLWHAGFNSGPDEYRTPTKSGKPGAFPILWEYFSGREPMILHTVALHPHLASSGRVPGMDSEHGMKLDSAPHIFKADERRGTHNGGEKSPAIVIFKDEAS